MEVREGGERKDETGETVQRRQVGERQEREIN